MSTPDSERTRDATDSTEWYWCNDCEADGSDNCGFYWDDDDVEPECPHCGSMDVQV